MKKPKRKNPYLHTITLDLYDYCYEQNLTFEDITEVFQYNTVYCDYYSSGYADVMNRDGEILMTLQSFTCNFFHRMYGRRD
jgi:hypothetical protein